MTVPSASASTAIKSRYHSDWVNNAWSPVQYSLSQITSTRHQMLRLGVWTACRCIWQGIPYCRAIVSGQRANRSHKIAFCSASEQVSCRRIFPLRCPFHLIDDTKLLSVRHLNKYHVGKSSPSIPRFIKR